MHIYDYYYIYIRLYIITWMYIERYCSLLITPFYNLTIVSLWFIFWLLVGCERLDYRSVFDKLSCVVVSTYFGLRQLPTIYTYTCIHAAIYACIYSKFCCFACLNYLHMFIVWLKYQLLRTTYFTTYYDYCKGKIL